MTWGDALENINYWAVIVGTLSTLVVGFLWYDPRGFGKEWMKLVGLKKKDMQNNQGMTAMMASSIIFYFLATVILSSLLFLTDMRSAGEGLLMGLIAGFIFGFGPITTTYGYARRKFELALIDGGYVVVALGLAGLIVGWWT